MSPDGKRFFSLHLWHELDLKSRLGSPVLSLSFSRFSRTSLPSFPKDKTRGTRSLFLYQKPLLRPLPLFSGLCIPSVTTDREEAGGTRTLVQNSDRTAQQIGAAGERTFPILCSNWFIQ